MQKKRGFIEETITVISVRLLYDISFFIKDPALRSADTCEETGKVKGKN